MSIDRIIPTSKPADLVTFTIKIDGTEIPRTILVQSIVVQKEINKISSARICMADGEPSLEDFEVASQDLFVPGKEIEIFAGYHSDETSIFKGIVITPRIRVRADNSQLIVDCKDEAVKLSIGRKSKYFFDKTDSDVVEEIINGYGLPNTIEATSVQHKELVQFDCTDWDFIITRLEANGYICITDEDGISSVKPSLDDDPVLELLFGATIIEFDSEMDARNQYEGVNAYSWDYAAQELLNVTAAEPGNEENGNISTADLSSVIGLASFDLKHTGQVPQEELQAWADAQLLKARLSKVKGRVKFQGFGDVKPATVLNLGGLGDRINGKVFVTGVRHEVADGDWLSDAQFGLSPDWFAVECPVNAPKAAAMLPAVNGLQIGIVTQLESDPNGEDRIQVRLPVVSLEEQGVWSRIASLDAGDNRGFFFRPEVGDEVVVGFLNDDPNNPVILGMLNSSAKPAPLQAAADNNIKAYVSRSAIKLTFDDDKKSVKLETPGGRFFLMDDDSKVIQMEDGSGNKIVLDDNGITIQSSKKISLKSNDDISIEGNNLSSKAQMSFKAEGTAGIELKSSATAVLKGALVQIN
ncbi:type VI secretion system tip protein VgrG [Parafilimonas sp.]|uniref:type VI secretion system tip protein VgrG n=1 Tax=Parafilimonas sp. TaxID=1969739 RepID=UPI0039E52A42